MGEHCEDWAAAAAKRWGTVPDVVESVRAGADRCNARACRRARWPRRSGVAGLLLMVPTCSRSRRADAGVIPCSPNGATKPVDFGDTASHCTRARVGDVAAGSCRRQRLRPVSHAATCVAGLPPLLDGSAHRTRAKRRTDRRRRRAAIVRARTSPPSGPEPDQDEPAAGTREPDVFAQPRGQPLPRRGAGHRGRGDGRAGERTGRR